MEPNTDLKSLLRPETTRIGLRGTSKKGVIEAIACALAKHHPSLQQDDLFDKLIAREKLGSTAVGHGVAIPHCKIDIDSPIAGLFKLRDAVNFDAVDSEPVNVLFVLLVPTNAIQAHLDLLSQIAEMMHTSKHRAALQNADSHQALLDTALEAMQTPEVS